MCAARQLARTLALVKGIAGLVARYLTRALALMERIAGVVARHVCLKGSGRVTTVSREEGLLGCTLRDGRARARSGGRFIVLANLDCLGIFAVKVGETPSQLVKNITGKVFEPIIRECRKFLSCLIPFGMEVFAHRQERG